MIDKKNDRVVLTKQKIYERLYQDVHNRIKLDVTAAIIAVIVMLVFGLITLDFYIKQNDAFGLMLGAVIILLLGMIGLSCYEMIMVCRMKRYIKNDDYIVLHDTLIRANENVKQIKNEIRFNYAYRSYRPPERVDEYMFESGMKYVRISNANKKDEFGLRGIMNYSKDPIPFIIVVHRDRPSVPVLLYNEQVFKYSE